MGTMGRRSWNCDSLSSFTFRCILRRQCFYSTSRITTTAESPIHSSTLPDSDSLSSFTNFLVGSLGFSEQQALSTSTKLGKLRESRGVKKVSGFNFLTNADSVISFLHNKGLDKPQIRNVVYSVPQILTSRIGQNLEPKMRVFEELGFSASDFAYVLRTQPGILAYGLDSTINPALEAMRGIMGSDKNVVKVIKGFRLNTLTLITKHIVYNVSLLKARGIPLESIQKRLITQSSSFFRKPEKFKEMLAQVEEKWGISPQSSVFLNAVHILGCYSDKSIESKVRVYESFGWDRSEVMDMFRRHPYCFTISEDMIKTKLRFFTDQVGWIRGDIVSRPYLLSYSLERRVLPRWAIFRILKEKGLVQETFPRSALTATETRFLNKFIKPFESHVPNLAQIYSSKIGSPAQHQSRGWKNIHFKPKSAS